MKILDWALPADRDRLQKIVDRYSARSWTKGELAEKLSQFMDDLRARGNEAIVDYLRTYTHSDYVEESIVVPHETIAKAGDSLDVKVVETMERVVENIRAYQRHIMPTDPPTLHRHGAELGMRHTPVASAGLSVPGGNGAYPSTLVMLSVPAQVAGVQRLVVATPPLVGTADVEIDSTVLGLCHLLEIETVYRIGGFALAALAIGTDTISPVEMIAGPSNIYGQKAKQQLFGTVGIDGVYGPSEIVVLADETANTLWIAADLLAQAEHNPGTAILITTEKLVIDKINLSLKKLLYSYKGNTDLSENCVLVQTPDLSAAYELIDELAPEHLTLAVAEPKKALMQVQNAGAIFLGDRTPVASGDYWAGPSHCLPTGGTARFSSGCSVYSFLKRTSIESYPQGLPKQAFDDIELLARIEGFDAHHNSVNIRRLGDRE